MCTAAVSRLMLTLWVVNVACVVATGEPVVHPIPVVAAISPVIAVATTRPRTLPSLMAPFPRSWCGPSTTHLIRAGLRDGFGAPAGHHTQHQPGAPHRPPPHRPPPPRNARPAQPPPRPNGAPPPTRGRPRPHA